MYDGDMRTKTYPSGLTIVHKLDSEPYRRWCSVRGVRRAARWGANALDVDMKLSRERVPFAVHWESIARGGFRDPSGKVGRGAKVGRLVADELARLVSLDGYRVWRIRRMMKVAAKVGVTLCLEAKPDRRWQDESVWAQLAEDADRTGADVIVMSQPHGGLGIAALAAAHPYLPTMLMTRGKPGKHVWKHLDYVKGPERWTEGAPAEVRVVGGHPGIATRWGCSCSATRQSIREARNAVIRAVARAH